MLGGLEHRSIFNAVKRALASLRAEISPDDSGCIGDGVADDTLPFQAAATRASGKVLKLAPGKTYLLSSVNVSAGTSVIMTGATVKQKPLAALNGSPMFNVQGTDVRFEGGTVDGNKAAQPADGFSDSYNTGANGTGRAYRAAIKADATVTAGITRLTVSGVRFKNTYGACVATLNVPIVRVQECRQESCNFELAFLYNAAGANTDAIITDNICDTTGSGDVAVNADVFTVTAYRRVKIADNIVYNGERCMCKVEGGSNISITNNIYDTNSAALGYAAVQIDTTAGANRIVVSGNNFYNTGKGIYLSGVGTVLNCAVTGNSVYTTTGATGDGFVTDGTITNLVIVGNNFADIKRQGIQMQGTITRGKISDNVLHGQGANQAMNFSNTGGSWGKLEVHDNVAENFEQSGVGNGVVVFAQTAANVFAFVSMTGNTFDAGADANRCVRNPADCITAGVLTANYIRGQLEHYSANFETYGNKVTGTLTIPQFTFTPALKFGGNQVGMTTSVAAGFYQRRGNVVHFTLRITLTAKGSSVGNATITGLPFAVKNVASEHSVPTLLLQSVTYAAGHPTCFLTPNLSQIDIGVQATAAAYAALTDAAFANNSDIIATGSYEITDRG